MNPSKPLAGREGQMYNKGVLPMRIFYNETLEKSDLENDLRLCAKYGYEGIEIRIEYLQEYLKTHTAAQLKQALKENGLTPLALNSVDDINFCTAAQWDAILERFLFACRMCRELDNPYIVVVPTIFDAMAEKPWEAVFADSVEVLRTLSGIAAPYGAKLAFEPIGNRKWCVRSIRQAVDIIRAVDRDNVGLALDAMNLYSYDGLRDMEDLRRIPEGKIFVLHMNDAMGLPLQQLDPEQHRLQPGDGVIPLKHFCEMLLERGYEGPASLELFNPIFSQLPPEQVMEEGYRKTKALIASLEA